MANERGGAAETVLATTDSANSCAPTWTRQAAATAIKVTFFTFNPCTGPPVRLSMELAGDGIHSPRPSSLVWVGPTTKTRAPREEYRQRAATPKNRRPDGRSEDPPYTDESAIKSTIANPL